MTTLTVFTAADGSLVAINPCSVACVEPARMWINDKYLERGARIRLAGFDYSVAVRESFDEVLAAFERSNRLAGALT